MELKIGDVVRLKSGGPAMTVNEVDSTYAYCAWSDKNHVILYGNFKPEILNIAKKGKVNPSYF